MINSIWILVSGFFYQIGIILLILILLFNTIFNFKIKKINVTLSDLSKIEDRIIAKTFEESYLTNGFFFGFLFFGMISVSNESYVKNEIECTIYCSEYIIECFKKINNSKLDNDNKIKNITILYPSSNTYWFKEWKEKFVPIDKFEPNYDQKNCLSKLMNNLEMLKNKSNNSNIYYFCGKPNTGKSTIAYMYANELLDKDYYVVLVEDLDLFQTGNKSDFIKLYSRFESLSISKKNKRLIIVMNEIDIKLQKMINNSYKENPQFNRFIKEKSDWNNFLDKIHGYVYSNVTIIFTSNKNNNWHMENNWLSLNNDNLGDSSLLRKGRIDDEFYFSEKIVS